MQQLLCALRDIKSVHGFKQLDWNQLLVQGYASGLLGRLCYLIQQSDLESFVPESQWWHFASAMQRSLGHSQDVRIEIRHIENALNMVGILPVYLKGAAYLMANDTVAQGRLFSDVDIYIPEEQLASAEHALKMHGWHHGEVTQHDHKYYREWMHEIPPLVHKTRGTTLDVHFRLVPRISRINFAQQIFAQSVISADRVLTPIDRCIHCIVHLFLETEFEKGLRDLSDIALLLVEHSHSSSGFWHEFIQRSESLGISALTYLGVRYSQTVLNLQVPTEIEAELLKLSGYSRLHLRWLDKLFLPVFIQPVHLYPTISATIAHQLLFIRGHWLKMPLPVLFKHSATKVLAAWRQ